MKAVGCFMIIQKVLSHPALVRAFKRFYNAPKTGTSKTRGPVWCAVLIFFTLVKCPILKRVIFPCRECSSFREMIDHTVLKGNIFFGSVNNTHLCSQSKLKWSQEPVILSAPRTAPRVPSSAVWFHYVLCILPSPSQLFNCFEMLNPHYLYRRSRGG